MGSKQSSESTATTLAKGSKPGSGADGKLQACQSKIIDPNFLIECDFWYVNVCTPVPLGDSPAPHDGVERYRWVDKEAGTFKVFYRYRQGSHSARGQTMTQDGYLYTETAVGAEFKSEWRVRPRLFNDSIGIPGLWLPYLILDAPTPSNPDYPFLIVGYPDRSLLWVMSRNPNPFASDAEYDSVVDRCEKEWGYSRKVLDKLYRVPHTPEGFLEEKE